MQILSHRHGLLSCISLLACLLAPVAGAAEDKPPPANPWENDIRAFEQQDQKRPPQPGGIVFVGSSTIRLWDLAESFPDLPCLNRGFGGSHMSDSAHFAARIVIPYKPRIVVVYAGGNDLNSGKSPQTVRDDFAALVQAVHDELPATTIIYLAIKPTVARWGHDDKIRETNALIQEWMRDRSGLLYFDDYPPFFGADGKPNAELLMKDGLHVNNVGYRLLTSLLRPELDKLLAEQQQQERAN